MSDDDAATTAELDGGSALLDTPATDEEGVALEDSTMALEAGAAALEEGTSALLDGCEEDGDAAEEACVALEDASCVDDAGDRDEATTVDDDDVSATLEDCTAWELAAWDEDASTTLEEEPPALPLLLDVEELSDGVPVVVQADARTNSRTGRKDGVRWRMDNSRTRPGCDAPWR